MDSKPITVGEQVYNNINARLSQLESQVSSVKIATQELIDIIDDATPADQKIETMTNLLFEDIGGQEIISIIRNDIVNGQNITYQPIKNVTSLYYQYNIHPTSGDLVIDLINMRLEEEVEVQIISKLSDLHDTIY